MNLSDRPNLLQSDCVLSTLDINKIGVIVDFLFLSFSPPFAFHFDSSSLSVKATAYLLFLRNDLPNKTKA